MNNLKIEKDNNKDAEYFIKLNLHKYNQKNCTYIEQNSSYAHVNSINGDFIIYKDNEIIGGALGYIKYGWYHLSDFYITDNFRSSGIGSKIIEKIEKFAKENNALGVKIDTWSFQAPDFYKKLGYIVWGEFKDCPPGTTTYCLYKKF